MATLDALRALLQARGNLAMPTVLSHPALPCRHVAWDHRAVQSGSLFVAKRGQAVDGHDFIPAALAAGAACVLGTETARQFAARCQAAGQPVRPYLHIRDSQRAYAQASALACDFPARRLVTAGITGTDGKTTSVGLLASILAQTPDRDGAAPVGTISTMGITSRSGTQDSGYHVTTPDAWEVQDALRQMVKTGCRYAVLECTSHGLAQHRVDETEMNAVGVTHITHEHLDYHGTFERYVQAKCSLLDRLGDSLEPGPGPAAILNRDDAPGCRALLQRMTELQAVRQHSIAVQTYGLDMAEAERGYWASGLELGPYGMQMAIAGPGLPRQICRSPLLGRFNAANILLAAALGHALGCTPHRIRCGVAAFQGIEGRMQRIDLGQDFMAIVDFAHSPASLDHALTAMRSLMDARSRLIAVFGSAGLRDRAKRHLMGAVGARRANHVIVTAEDPRTESLEDICQAVAEGVRSAGTDTTWEIVPDRARALERAVALATAGDVVAAFGKGHERSMCFGETEYAWSEQTAMANAIRKRLDLPVAPDDCIYHLPTRGT